MAQNPDHSRLINSAAKSALSPLGFRQKGRSRLWFADRGFWEIIVEFTPSGFGKGSHLTLAAMWLWHPSTDWAFDYCRRLEGLVRFENAKQFAGEADRLASHAATEAASLESRFSSLDKIASFLVENISRNHWSWYHAAVASGLAGNVEQSRVLFDQLKGQKAQASWQRELQKTASRLAEQLNDAAQFQASVEKLISATRKRQKLSKQKTYF